jgi:ribosomal protein S18 acetylase RimI-like enzyme
MGVQTGRRRRRLAADLHPFGCTDRWMIEYRDFVGDLSESDLEGFFEGWPNPPSPAAHLRLLRQSSAILLAIDSTNQTVAGFITAISDGVLSAYIPLLEVRRAYRRRGIGSDLVREMVNRLRHLYMIDLICDSHLQPFYRRLGMNPTCGASVRNYDRQSAPS